MAFLRSLAIAFAFLILSPDETLSFLIVTDHSMSRMVAFESPGHTCSTSSDRKVIMRAVMSSHSHQMVRTENDEDMGALVDACIRHMDNEVAFNPRPGGFIFPGTKWCGPGDSARNYEDLGRKRAEDMCCREHDNCPSFLSPGECRSGICNKSPFTRSECKCDQQFQRCLQRVRSSTADTIGALYFNVARIMCFRNSTQCMSGTGECGLFHSGRYYNPFNN